MVRGVAVHVHEATDLKRDCHSPAPAKRPASQDAIAAAASRILDVSQSAFAIRGGRRRVELGQRARHTRCGSPPCGAPGGNHAGRRVSRHSGACASGRPTRRWTGGTQSPTSPRLALGANASAAADAVLVICVAAGRVRSVEQCCSLIASEVHTPTYRLQRTLAQTDE
jgi:hypothetical protein